MKKLLLSALVLFSTSLFAQSWVQLADAPVGRHHPISFAIDGKGYAITGTLANGQPTDDAYQYDPATNTWTTLTDFPGTSRSFGIGAVSNGIAYLGFGASNATYLNDLWSFDPATGVWTQLADCNCSGRRHPAMIANGDNIYVGLGDDQTGDLDDWYMYTISTNTWIQLADLPGPSRHHPFMFNADGEIYAGLGHSGNIIYTDWYKLNTSSNTWTAMNSFPGEGRVAGTQFDLNGYGFVLSGDGDNHSYMPTGEMWRYSPSSDSWLQLTPHPGQSRWAPGSFVIDEEVYFFGGRNRLTNIYPNDLWKFDLAAVTVGIEEEVLENTYVYPNPANEFISWENDESITEIRVFNTLGQLVLSSDADQKRMNTQSLKNGLYLVQFYASSKRMKSSKVLIQH